MKLDEEMNRRAFGAEHLVDQNHYGDANKKVCQMCGGAKKIPLPQRIISPGIADLVLRYTDCPACHGTGKMPDIKTVCILPASGSGNGPCKIPCGDCDDNCATCFCNPVAKQVMGLFDDYLSRPHWEAGALRDDILALIAKRDEEQQKDRKVLCVHCGYSEEQGPGVIERMIKHEGECKINPLVQRIAELKSDLSADRAEIERLKVENERLRKDAAELFIEEMHAENGDMVMTMNSKVGLVLAQFMRDMITSSGGENFVTAQLQFECEDPIYFTFGRALGKSVDEKYREKCAEIDQIKADKAELVEASYNVLDEIWDRCDCFTEAQQALHSLIAKHTEAKS